MELHCSCTAVAMGLMREQNLRNFVTLLSFLVWVVHVEAKKGKSVPYTRQHRDDRLQLNLMRVFLEMR